MTLEKELLDILLLNDKISIEKADINQIYNACLTLVKQHLAQKPQIVGKKKLYYISAEFLIGKLFSNNCINLNIYSELDEILRKYGYSMAELENVDIEPSLGNGGLGRLAACFLDSIATLGLSGDGIGLNYHFGLFKQVFENHKQIEEKNDWIKEHSWLNLTDIGFDVEFGDFTLHSKLYDLDIVGYEQGINKLHLFDLEGLNEALVENGIDFDKTKIDENCTLFLYPDDSDEAGRLLRIYQQYFMVSNGAQYILKEMKEAGHDLRELDKHVVIQINDTHPTLVIPELIHRLMKEGILMKEAIQIVRRTCAYTNHTILAEALETWPRAYLMQVVPHLMPIIEALDTLVASLYDHPQVQIIDQEDRVHMAHIDIHFTKSTNGVAAIHTEILKNTELKPFYELYPTRFNNKTNGITFRRWLYHCNHELTAFLSKQLKGDFKHDATALEELTKYVNDESVLEEIAQIKQVKKQQLCDYVWKTQQIQLDPHSVFTIQIKRLHEYKRQQMNALWIIYEFQRIKNGFFPKRPITIIFGAKAAPAYIIAKDIIHCILSLAEIVNNDPDVSPYLKVVMIENYNVSKAEMLIPACDISEQISLASKEASGTGNMKFMLNGAVTLGTMDGANVEIADLVGKKNIFVFGESSDQVIAHYENKDYSSKKLYKKDKTIRNAVDFIIGKEMLAIGDEVSLTRLHQELINKDWFMTLLDFKSYIRCKEKALDAYENQFAWRQKMLMNIAKAGFFSSDRTISEYERDIWKLNQE